MKITKYIFDLIIGLIIFIISFPMILMISYLIYQEGETIIFSHRRVGQNGKFFNCLKFRTMTIDAEDRLKILLETDPKIKEEWETDFKLKQDPRVTKIGQFLRKTSLDELPQLWNVLRGEMSLVGPRPIVEEELAYYGKDVDYYLSVKPGMTGLWQISGRNDISYDERVALDVKYVKQQSLWLDLTILFKTINVVLFRKDGY